MLTILCFALHSALAAPPDAPPPPPGPPDTEEHGGGRGGREHDRGEESDRLMKHFPEIAKKLGLNADQKASVEKLYYDSKSTGIDLQAKSDKARLELERVMMADTLDEKTALKDFEAAAAAETEVRRNDLKLMLGLRKILTPEQWTALKELREEKRERRGGRGDDDDHDRHGDD
jgi:Spy/CpxP family protein refolding chaperone